MYIHLIHKQLSLLFRLLLFFGRTGAVEISLEPTHESRSL